LRADRVSRDGHAGYGRNLTAGEIVEQVYIATNCGPGPRTWLMGWRAHANLDNVTRAGRSTAGAALLAAADHGLDGGLVPGIEKLVSGARRPTRPSR
jgi:adenine C2-methylase RlmN of 23S rRNA A2503 and tRNA A37